jgi:hypothetical protein
MMVHPHHDDRSMMCRELSYSGLVAKSYEGLAVTSRPSGKGSAISLILSTGVGAHPDMLHACDNVPFANISAQQLEETLIYTLSVIFYLSSINLKMN